MLSISRLQPNHDRSAFDCGNEALNRFIKQQASQLIRRNETAIYVAHEGSRIAGFYTLSACQIEQNSDPEHFKKQSPHVPIPCVLLGRLAVDNSYRGMGLGGDLLLHALQAVKQLATMLGVACVVVDAKDDTAQAFYLHYGFYPLQSNPMRLCFAVQKIPD